MEHTCQQLTPGNGKPCQHYIRSNKADEPGFCSQPTRFRCTEAMKVKLSPISYSSFTDYVHCKERYKHQNIDGLQMKSEHLPEPLKLGRAWDAYGQYLFDGTDHQQVIAPLQLSEPQQAKINGLARAYQDLDVSINKVGLMGCQFKIHVPIGQEQIIGYVDRAYDDHIVESKLSGRPDFFKQKENLIKHRYRLCIRDCQRVAGVRLRHAIRIHVIKKTIQKEIREKGRTGHDSVFV